MKKLFMANNHLGGDRPRQTTVTKNNLKEENFMKKLFTVVLVLVMVLNISAAFAAPEAQSGSVVNPATEKYNLTLTGADENGAIEYLDGRWVRARRAQDGAYLTWSINKMFQGERQLNEGESLTQIKSDVVDVNLTADLYGSVSFRVDPAALIQQTGEDGKLQDKVPYEMALVGNAGENAILAAFVSLNEAYRGTELLVEWLDATTNEVLNYEYLTLHRLALNGGPTVDDANDRWSGTLSAWGYRNPSTDDRDQENSYVELPPSHDYIVKVSGNLAAIDWINIGVLLLEGSDADGWSGGDSDNK